MTTNRMGLLVMAYGTPRSTEEIEPYYTHIRRGRTPTPELLQELTDRYEKIGGISPLARITEEQASALEAKLNHMQDKYEFKAYLGLKHIEPFIEDGIRHMNADGIEEAVSIVLAPHYSTFSAKSYNGRALEESKKAGGPTLYSINSSHEDRHSSAIGQSSYRKHLRRFRKRNKRKQSLFSRRTVCRKRLHK